MRNLIFVNLSLTCVDRFGARVLLDKVFVVFPEWRK